jgi:hypothetical protein
LNGSLSALFAGGVFGNVAGRDFNRVDMAVLALLMNTALKANYVPDVIHSFLKRLIPAAMVCRRALPPR